MRTILCSLVHRSKHCGYEDTNVTRQQSLRGMLKQVRKLISEPFVRTLLRFALSHRLYLPSLGRVAANDDLFRIKSSTGLSLSLEEHCMVFFHLMQHLSMTIYQSLEPAMTRQLTICQSPEHMP